MKLYDISPVIHPGIAVWPGDTLFTRRKLMRLSDAAFVNLSSVTLSLHTGAHADAPLHVLPDATSIDLLDLAAFLGPARVVTLNDVDSIREADLHSILAQNPERLLIRCRREYDPDRFPQAVTWFTEQAATRIAEAGVKLIGTDEPSIDPIDSTDLPAHKAFGRAGTAILENIDLRAVPDGEYELIALPLKIRGGDASPVRAILRELSGH